VLKRKRPRPVLNRLDRFFWTTLRRCWPRWTDVLVIVKPETVVGWHRAGFRLPPLLALAITAQWPAYDRGRGARNSSHGFKNRAATGCFDEELFLGVKNFAFRPWTPNCLAPRILKLRVWRSALLRADEGLPERLPGSRL
jgi:hypothetical protein